MAGASADVADVGTDREVGRTIVEPEEELVKPETRTESVEGVLNQQRGILLIEEMVTEICNGCDRGVECRYCHLFKFIKSIDYVGLLGMTVKEAVKLTRKEENAAIREANERCDRELGRYAVNLRGY